MIRSEFVIPFEGSDIPKLVFVSVDGISFDLYIDGKLAKGIEEINIHGSLDEYVKYTTLITSALTE